MIQELNELSKLLTHSGDQLKKYGRELAQAEHDYKVILRQEALKLRADGMAITLIDKVVYGIDEVADARLKRDIAETMYKAAQESINTLKLKMRIIDAQIDREWRSNG